jgi:hypothetical protein
MRNLAVITLILLFAYPANACIEVHPDKPPPTSIMGTGDEVIYDFTEDVHSFYFNPVKNYMIVDFDFGKLKTVEENGILIVSTIDGKLIETLPLNSNRGQLVYPLNTYKTGTYIFSLYYSNQMLDSKRLIIQ